MCIIAGVHELREDNYKVLKDNYDKRSALVLPVHNFDEKITKCRVS